MTAVEWLIDQIEQFHCLLPVDMIEQAKAMEKEQITEAYTIGSYDMAEKEFRPEQYYNETYENSKTPPGAHCEEA